VALTPRVYILLDTVEGKANHVGGILRGKPGVELVDVLEGPPDVVTVIKARGHRQLAKFATQALASVETMTENLQLLPTKDSVGMRWRRKGWSKSPRGDSNLTSGTKSAT